MYEGYSEPLYDRSARTAQYVEVRDGTLLAVDIYRPTLNGQFVEEPLPVSRSWNASFIELPIIPAK